MINISISKAFAPILLAVAACAPLSEPYSQPEVATPVSFVSGGREVAPANPQWWKGLNDQVLNRFVEQGLEQNLTLQAARVRLQAAEQALTRTGPRSRLTGDATLGATAIRDFDVNDSDVRQTANLGASYVFGLFGRDALQTGAAVANRDIAAFSAAQSRLAFQAQLVAAYLEARFQKASQVTLQETLRGRRDTLFLVNQQLEAGVVTALDVARAQAQIDTIEAAIPQRRAAYQSAVFSIATLLARPASEIMAELQTVRGQPVPAAGSGVGVPASLILHRPDVRSAEASLRAATVAAGIAETDLYPSISLSGSISLEPSQAISFGPSLRIPVFNRGILEARRREAALEAEAAELAWRQTILVAIQEVQSNQAELTASRERAAELNDAERNLRRLLSLSRETLGAGETTALQLLDAQQDLNSNQLNRLEALNSWARSWARLQIALGHGWTPQ